MKKKTKKILRDEYIRSNDTHTFLQVFKFHFDWTGRLTRDVLADKFGGGLRKMLRIASYNTQCQL